MEKYILAIMDKDGILPELFQWFELEAQVQDALKDVKDRGAYALKVIAVGNEEGGDECGFRFRNE